MKKIILMILFCSISMGVFGDISADLTNKPYTPSFGDWVYVYLKAVYSEQSVTHGVMVARKRINDKTRFIIKLYYDSSARWYFDDVWPGVKKTIEYQCNWWTAEGYPISMNDFSFDVQEVKY